MLETKDYSIAELEEIMKTRGKQNLDRKLDRRLITYTSAGRAENRVYTIKDIPDKFKVYAYTKLGIPAQADFTKIRNLYYYLFCAEGFAEKPLIEMERIMGDNGVPMSRQMISKWVNYLQHIDYITFSTTNCRYYAIYKNPSGEREYSEIDKETYNAGWRMYFDCKEKTNPQDAYAQMYHYIGGHPYKKPEMLQNGIYEKDINELIEVINDSFLENPIL